MSMSMPVVRARWCDAGRIVDLVTETLSLTPLGGWLVPDGRRRAAVLADVARIWVEHALLFGDAFLLRDGTAATVWFHRYRPIPPPPRYVERLAVACGPDLDRFRLLDRELAARRPTEPHNHLALLAAPGSDEAGRAAALTGGQRWMDTLGLPTYAEALSDTDRDLYRRHGYHDRDAVAVPDGPAARAMWRLSPFWTGRPGGSARWASRRTPARGRNGRASAVLRWV